MQRDERIQRRAYELWQLAGSPPEREQEFWFQAEQEVITEEVRDEIAVQAGKTPDAENQAG